MPTKLHKEYHKGLDNLLPRYRGAEYYRKLSPEQQAQDFEKFREYTEAFDEKHGTKLWEKIQETASATEKPGK